MPKICKTNNQIFTYIHFFFYYFLKRYISIYLFFDYGLFNKKRSFILNKYSCFKHSYSFIQSIFNKKHPFIFIDPKTSFWKVRLTEKLRYNQLIIERERISSFGFIKDKSKFNSSNLLHNFKNIFIDEKWMPTTLKILIISDHIIGNKYLELLQETILKLTKDCFLSFFYTNDNEIDMTEIIFSMSRKMAWKTILDKYWTFYMDIKDIRNFLDSLDKGIPDKSLFIILEAKFKLGTRVDAFIRDVLNQDYYVDFNELLNRERHLLIWECHHLVNEVRSEGRDWSWDYEIKWWETIGIFLKSTYFDPVVHLRLRIRTLLKKEPKSINRDYYYYLTRLKKILKVIRYQIGYPDSPGHSTRQYYDRLIDKSFCWSGKIPYFIRIFLSKLIFYIVNKEVEVKLGLIITQCITDIMEIWPNCYNINMRQKKFFVFLPVSSIYLFFIYWNYKLAIVKEYYFYFKTLNFIYFLTPIILKSIDFIPIFNGSVLIHPHVYNFYSHEYSISNYLLRDLYNDKKQSISYFYLFFTDLLLHTEKIYSWCIYNKINIVSFKKSFFILINNDLLLDFWLIERRFRTSFFKKLKHLLEYLGYLKDYSNFILVSKDRYLFSIINIFYLYLKKLLIFINLNYLTLGRSSKGLYD